MAEKEKQVGNPTVNKSPDSGFTYKSSRIFKPMPPATLDLIFFKKMFFILNNCNRELAEIDVSRLKIQPSQSQEDFDSLKEYAKSLYRVTIHIYGSKGEYIMTENVDTFDSPDLPDSVSKIEFENSSRFRVSLEKELGNQFKITFDFTKPKIFDFNVSPSLATPVNSAINIIGENEIWVSGVYQKVISPLEERKNKHGWLHGNNIYDIFVWILFMPVIFRSMYVIQQALPQGFANMSGVLKGAIYVYAFFLFLNVFRIIFSYARWVFPYLELNSPLIKTKKHRYILGAIILSMICAVVFDLGRTIIFLLIKS